MAPCRRRGGAPLVARRDRARVPEARDETCSGRNSRRISAEGRCVMATASASPASHVADWSDGWLVVLVSSGAHDGPPTPLQRQCQAAIAKYEAARLTGRGLELARRRLREVGGLVQQVAEAERQQTREMRAAERAAEERDRCAACRER